MHPGFEPILSDWILLLKSQDKCFVLPKATLRELQQLSTDKDRLVKANAICALDTLRILVKNDVVRIADRGASERCPESEDEIIAMLRACRTEGSAALVLTQSKKLAAACMRMSVPQGKCMGLSDANDLPMNLASLKPCCKSRTFGYCC